MQKKGRARIPPGRAQKNRENLEQNPPKKLIIIIMTSSKEFWNPSYFLRLLVKNQLAESYGGAKKSTLSDKRCEGRNI